MVIFLNSLNHYPEYFLLFRKYGGALFPHLSVSSPWQLVILHLCQTYLRPSGGVSSPLSYKLLYTAGVSSPSHESFQYWEKSLYIFYPIFHWFVIQENFLILKIRGFSSRAVSNQERVIIRKLISVYISNSKACATLILVMGSVMGLLPLRNGVFLKTTK